MFARQRFTLDCFVVGVTEVFGITTTTASVQEIELIRFAFKQHQRMQTDGFSDWASRIRCPTDATRTGQVGDAVFRNGL